MFLILIGVDEFAVLELSDVFNMKFAWNRFFDWEHFL